MPLTTKIVAGLLAGSVGNPADVAMVRMQADGRGIVPDGEPGDAGDGVAAGIVRPVQGDDSGEGVDEGRADDPRDGELRCGIHGGSGFEPGGRDQDEGDEHEGGGGESGAVRRGGGLCREDGEGGGVGGAVQRVEIQIISRQSI